MVNSHPVNDRGGLGVVRMRRSIGPLPPFPPPSHSDGTRVTSCAHLQSQGRLLIGLYPLPSVVEILGLILSDPSTVAPGIGITNAVLQLCCKHVVVNTFTLWIFILEVNFLNVIN